MTIVPSGNPAWVRSNDHTAYGGHVNKTNYASVDAVNPRTDLSAQNLTRMAADLAAVARTAPFAVITFTTNDTSPAAPTIDDYTAMAGASPVGARNGDGDVNLTWDASYADPYAVSADIHIAGVTASGHGANDYSVAVTISDPDANGKNERIRVQVFDSSAGSSVTDVTVTLAIYTAPV
jgi:hypothetical protein